MNLIDRIVVSIITLIDCLSLGSCVWLVCRLRRLPEAQRRRLFPRQVLVLAASDVCAVLPWSYLFRFGTDEYDDAIHHPLFTALNVGRCWSYHATLLAELHIVLGFAAQMFAWPRANHCLSFCLWLPWLLAGILTGFDLWLSWPMLDWGPPANSVACLCFLIALATFVAVLCRARASNIAVARRSWRRAASYVANFLITFAPMVCITFKAPPDSAETLKLLVWAPFHLNGFLNALTYFAQSRYSRSKEPTHEDPRGHSSLVVRFEGVGVDDLAGEEKAKLQLRCCGGRRGRRIRECSSEGFGASCEDCGCSTDGFVGDAG